MAPASLVLPALLACFALQVSAQDLPQGSCPGPGATNDTIYLPHPTNCSNFYTCSNGVLILQHCPAGLYFNIKLNVCDWPINVDCVSGCLALHNDEGGTWTPASCTTGSSKLESSCKLKCNPGFQLRGASSVECTERGWNSVNGGSIPKCVPEECIGEDLDNDLNKTLSVKAGILFVVDESGSVGITNYRRNKEFVKDVVKKYPLSEDRSAGVITFDARARTQIHLNVESTSDFLKAVDGLAYSNDGTSILAGLNLAIDEINKYAKHSLTLIILITDGLSTTDGTPAADKLKNAGHPLFAIGINKDTNLKHLEDLASTGENGIKHFFHVTSYEVLENIGKYLNPSEGPSEPKEECHYI